LPQINLELFLSSDFAYFSCVTSKVIFIDLLLKLRKEIDFENLNLRTCKFFDQSKCLKKKISQRIDNIEGTSSRSVGSGHVSISSSSALSEEYKDKSDEGIFFGLMFLALTSSSRIGITARTRGKGKGKGRGSRTK
jgi:hypothetical protein